MASWVVRTLIVCSFFLSFTAKAAVFPVCQTVAEAGFLDSDRNAPLVQKLTGFLLRVRNTPGLTPASLDTDTTKFGFSLRELFTKSGVPWNGGTLDRIKSSNSTDLYRYLEQSMTDKVENNRVNGLLASHNDRCFRSSGLLAWASFNGITPEVQSLVLSRAGDSGPKLQEVAVQYPPGLQCAKAGAHEPASSVVVHRGHTVRIPCTHYSSTPLYKVVNIRPVNTSTSLSLVQVSLPTSTTCKPVPLQPVRLFVPAGEAFTTTVGPYCDAVTITMTGAMKSRRSTSDGFANTRIEVFSGESGSGPSQCAAFKEIGSRGVEMKLKCPSVTLLSRQEQKFTWKTTTENAVASVGRWTYVVKKAPSAR